MPKHFDDNLFTVEGEEFSLFDQKIREFHQKVRESQKIAEEYAGFGRVEYMFAVNARGHVLLFVRKGNEVEDLEKEYEGGQEYKVWRGHYDEMSKEAKKRGRDLYNITLDIKGNEHNVPPPPGCEPEIYITGESCRGYKITVLGPNHGPRRAG